MIRRPPRSTLMRSSAASDVYKRQVSTQSTGRNNRTESLISFKMASRMGHVNTRDEVLEAFAVFDAGRKGHLTSAELQRVLNDLGEMISPQEAQTMLQQVAGQDGLIHYEQIVNSWFSYDG
eukprot:TRINITY_DN1246_c0_g2_i1.p1 TRINITY_DN1246_c0_g2~~TRINITY_DN1246_c0_g2_i1.p1  ORF type:complete len:121 (+),score=26.35 TRINITY_DN1246_c0_g2_i1:3-365(+)